MSFNLDIGQLKNVMVIVERKELMEEKWKQKKIEYEG